MRKHDKWELSRRDALRLSIGGAYGMALLGLSRSAGEDRIRLSLPDPGTTLDRTILPGARRLQHLPYRHLEYGPAQEIVIREDLCARTGTDDSRRRGLAAFGHLTDAHVLDAANPGRLSFLWQYINFSQGFPGSGRFRPQDLLTVQVLDAAVRKLNAVRYGPLSRRPLDCLVSTGDLTNNHALGELSAAVGVFKGGFVTAHPAGAYEGVQDYGPAPLALSENIWHPEPEPASIPADNWKALHGYPTVPGFLTAAIQPVRAEGASCPWYMGFGNHDEAGRAPSVSMSPRTKLIDDLRLNGLLPVGLPPGMKTSDFWKAVERANVTERRALIQSMPSRAVGPSMLRRPFSKAEFMDTVPDNPDRANNGSRSGPGSEVQPYYTFDISPGVVGIMLNTASPDGSAVAVLDDPQAMWLEEQLRSFSRTAFDPRGGPVTSDVEDRLVVLFSHHPLSAFGRQGNQRPGAIPSLSRESLYDMISRFPNVILWMNGHRHRHKVRPHKSPHGKGGLWEVTTASLIDYPQQSRVAEILDNGDGTLSIALTLLDHSTPENVVYDGPQTPESLAALSLELAINRPGLDRTKATGGARDQNVDLLLRKPF